MMIMTMQWMGKDGLVKFCLVWFVLVWCIGVYLGEIGADGHHVMALAPALFGLG